MALDVDAELAPDPGPAPDTPDLHSHRRRRGRRSALIAVGVVLALVAAAALWFVVGRVPAEQLTDDQALVEFRANGAAVSGSEGLPDAGVYAATATGTESIGLPGFDEALGPNAPVTVTHGERGCFTYRADLNSHHWRSWTLCPTETALFAVTELDSWTARKAPGLDIETLTTYVCERPLDLLWPEASTGQTRTSQCTGTNDLDDSSTEDSGVAEILGRGALEIAGERVEVIHLRTTDTFSGDQTGAEVAQWWIDARSGLPMRISLDASLTGGPSDYGENFELHLTTLSPAT